MSEIFETIYKENRWGGKVSRSGHGSDPDYVQQILEPVQALINKYNIDSIIDLGCGDCAWQPRCFTHVRLRYTGVDCVKELVDNNIKRFPAATFVHSPIERTLRWDQDLVVCRDVLVHLPIDTVKHIVSNIYHSGSKYALITTFPHVEHNTDCNIGEWRPLNMELLFGCDPIELISEQSVGKFLGLWELKKGSR